LREWFCSCAATTRNWFTAPAFRFTEIV